MDSEGTAALMGLERSLSESLQGLLDKSRSGPSPTHNSPAGTDFSIHMAMSISIPSTALAARSVNISSFDWSITHRICTTSNIGASK